MIQLAMTRNQDEREKIQRMRADVEAARQRELRLLSEARRDADPRYVQDVVAFLWPNIVQRKFTNRHSLRTIDRKRLYTLLELVA